VLGWLLIRVDGGFLAQFIFLSVQAFYFNITYTFTGLVEYENTFTSGMFVSENVFKPNLLN